MSIGDLELHAHYSPFPQISTFSVLSVLCTSHIKHTQSIEEPCGHATTSQTLNLHSTPCIITKVFTSTNVGDTSNTSLVIDCKNEYNQCKIRTTLLVFEGILENILDGWSGKIIMLKKNNRVLVRSSMQLHSRFLKSMNTSIVLNYTHVRNCTCHRHASKKMFTQT